ncbi:MAG: hypothetical protein ACLFUV_08605 [Methanomassiliicoccales archaeon]
MESSALDASHRLEKTQKQVEYVLAVVVPGLLALMLFSYVLFDPLFEPFLLASISAAALTVVPAAKLHSLHFQTWYRNLLPMKLISSGIGMVYILSMSVFSVSMVSSYEGLNPERPLTFIILGGLVTALIILLAVNARYRDYFLSMEKRHFRREPRTVEERVMRCLKERGIHYVKRPEGRGQNIVLDRSGLRVRIAPLGGRSTEVIVENIRTDNMDKVRLIKEYLD